MLAAGRTRANGVANFMEDHLENLLSEVDVVPAVNQIEVHPYLSQPQLRSLMAEHGIATQAAAYHSKYARRYPSIVPSIFAPQTQAATLKLVPKED